MKKFLSLVLALAMIISCVSMVSFTANAEEEIVGVLYTAAQDIPAKTNIYANRAAGFTVDDAVDGVITKSYVVYNPNKYPINVNLYYQDGWTGLGTVEGGVVNANLNIGALKKATATFTIPVAEDGTVTYSSGTKTTTIDKIALRVDIPSSNPYAIPAGTQFFIEAPAGDVVHSISAGSSYNGAASFTKTSVTEYPDMTYPMGDGTLEEDASWGWGTIHGGSFSAVADPADANNTVAKLTASSAYHSIFFDFGPYIFNDPDLYYAGHGNGAYKISFKYKADPETFASYTGNAQFAVTINSQNHLSAAQVKAALPDATYTHDTYYIGETITLTEEWQTYTETFTFDQAYDMLVDLRHNSVANTGKQASTYQFGLRLDGGSKAFKDAQFNYFIDDVEIEYLGTKLGVANEITTAGGDAAYPYWRNGSLGLTEAMAVDNVITIAYDVYNIGETNIESEIQLQNGWSSISGLTQNEFVPAKSMNTLTLKVKTDGNGNCVKEDGTVVCALSALTFRFQYTTAGSRAVGTSYLLVPKNDLSATIINAMTGKDASWSGGDAGVAKSFDYIGMELPDYVVVTPTPVPTPTPKAVSNGDAENGTTNWTSFLAGGSMNIIDEHTIDETVAEGTNHVASYLPAGQYATLGFDVGPYIVQDADDYFFGNGAGTYTVTFRAKAEAGQGGGFLLYINSLWHQNKGATIGDYTITGNTYQQGNPAFTLNDQWQTFTIDVQITDAFLTNLYNAAAQADAATKAKIYQLNLRFDGSNKAFKLDGADNYFTYYVDDVTISYAPPATPTPTPTPKPTPAGLKLTSNTGLTASTYFNGGKLAAATGFTGTKEYTYKIHNVADQAVVVNMSVQTLHNGGWHAATGSTTQVTIPADSFMIVTSTATVTNGKVVVSGTEYDLSACWIRINQTYSAGAQEGDGIIIEAPNGDPLYNGSGSNVTKSEVYELPTYEPYTLVNGDVSQGEIGDTTIEGWTTWNGGSNTIVQDPTDENNKVIKFVPTQNYSTTAFKVAPVVYNDGIRYFGNGIGVYTITLRARLEDASYLEGLDDATVTKATAFDLSLCGQKGYSHNNESNSYNTNSKRIHLTGDWQTFTITIPVRDNNYNGWVAAADGANVFVRLDASGTSSAFMYTGSFAPVNYLIDDVTIEYKGVMRGYLFEKSGANYYVTSGSSVFDADDVVNNYITSTQTFYNPNDYDINLEYCVQGTVPTNADGSSKGWHGYSESALIKPGQKATLTVKVPVNPETGNAIITAGAYGGYAEVAISTLFMRINLNKIGEDYAPNGTQFVVEADYKGTFGTKYESSAWNKGYIGITPDFNIVGANLELGSTLTINYYASLGEGYEDATMNFVRNGQTTSVEGVLVTEGDYAGLYKFAYTGINPQAMGDNIEAYLINDGQTIARLRRYSVKDYAINKYGTEDAKLDTLIADMLAYGAASQNHTGYKTDALVTDDAYAGIENWTFTTFDAASLEPTRTIVKNDGAYKVKSVGMNISNVYKLKFTLTGDATGAVVKLNGEEVAVDGGVVYTDAITATGSKQIYTITVEIDGVETSEVQYNVDAYINAKYEGSTVVDIVKAIANYSNAAIAYAN